MSEHPTKSGLADRPSWRTAHTIASILNLPVLLAAIAFTFGEWRALDRATRDNETEIENLVSSIERMERRLDETRGAVLENERAMLLRAENVFTNQDARDMEARIIAQLSRLQQQVDRVETRVNQRADAQ